MTIASADKEIWELIRDKHVTGAEAILAALVRPCRDDKYLDRQYLHARLDKVYSHEEYHWKHEKEGGGA